MWRLILPVAFWAKHVSYKSSQDSDSRVILNGMKTVPVLSGGQNRLVRLFECGRIPDFYFLTP